VDNEAELIKQFQGGDIKAFDRLFDHYCMGLLAYVKGMVGDKSLAEDIVQDCFVELVEKIDRLNPDKGLSGWIYRVARNRTIDVMRRRKFEVSGEDCITNGQGETQPGPRDCLVEKEREINAKELLGTLPENERTLLMLRYYSGLSFREIAEVLRRPLGTVLWQARRSLRKMRDIADEM